MFNSRIELERLQLEQRRAVDKHQRYIGRLLTDIRLAIDFRSPKSKMNVHDFRNMTPKVGRRGLTNDIVFKSARLRDGVGIDFITPNDFLEIRQHRLIIPKHGDPEYTRKTIDADAQMLDTPPIDVVGVDAMAEIYEMPQTLGHCLGALSVEQAMRWPNAY